MGVGGEGVGFAAGGGGGGGGGGDGGGGEGGGGEVGGRGDGGGGGGGAARLAGETWASCAAASGGATWVAASGRVPSVASSMRYTNSLKLPPFLPESPPPRRSTSPSKSSISLGYLLDNVACTGASLTKLNDLPTEMKRSLSSRR